MSTTAPPSSGLSIPVVARSGSASVGGDSEKKGFFGTLKSKLSSNKTATTPTAASQPTEVSKVDQKQAIKEREKGKSKEVSEQDTHGDHTAAQCHPDAR